MRPILDTSKSLYQLVAKWLTGLLDSVRLAVSEPSFRDTFDFMESVKNLDLSGKRMLSLDVTLLFTKVPISETVGYSCKPILQNNVNAGVPADELRQLHFTCIQNVQIRFNELVYRQKAGEPLRKPPRPLFADVFIAKIENTPLQPLI